MTYADETGSGGPGAGNGPIDAVERDHSSVSHPAAGARSPAQETIELLLVEDDDGDALLVEDQLAEGLPRARVSRSHTLARRSRRRRMHVDCVLLDLQLPDAAGWRRSQGFARGPRRSR